MISAILSEFMNTKNNSLLDHTFVVNIAAQHVFVMFPITVLQVNIN